MCLPHKNRIYVIFFIEVGILLLVKVLTSVFPFLYGMTIRFLCGSKSESSIFRCVASAAHFFMKGGNYMCIMSLVSIGVSILGTVIYATLFSGSGLTWLFVIISIASVVLPPIAKKLRITQEKKGKEFEIIAIVVGGFNFYCIFFALTTLPIFIGYLGWIICGIAYKFVK